MNILNTFLGKVLDLTVVPVGRHLGYVIFYRGNIKELKKEAKKLKATRNDVEGLVGAARNNNEVIKETVQDWVCSVNKITDQAEWFLEKESDANTGCSHSSCPNLWLRYKLSKEASKMAAEFGELNREGKFDKVSTHQMLPQCIGPSSVVEAFESRVSTMSEIMEALIDPTVHSIGLYGLGGVGKTTLAKQVAEKAQDEKLFDMVLVVEVKHFPIKEIQSQIAGLLGLQFGMQRESEIIRANQLYQRLEQEKSLLIVFDDLWERLDFRQVGIPFADKLTKCKFIFTSRNVALLSSQMNCKKNIMVELLSEKEAWVLFKKMAEIDEHSDPLDLVSKATEVSQKCARLPVVIVAVARALRNNKSLVDWKDALRRLNSYSSRKISGIEEVDSSIKLSYDYLKRELKSTFLLSAMFSQDPLIMELLMYAVGLGFLEGVHNMEAARDRIYALVRQLKTSSLLLDSYSEDRFTIHDVVRDVALSIAFEEQHALVKRREKVDEWPNEYKPESCTAICLDQSDIDGLPEGLYGPKVEFFYLNSKDPQLNIPSSFFNGMQEVKVLSLSNMTLSSLPTSISLLNKLTTLSLYSCMLKDIALVENLKVLKILNLSNSRINQLPCEVGRLGCLKILNLSCCYELEVIPPNILSNLKKLEELYMRDSFDKWEAEGFNEGKERASLDELKHLEKLSTLEIDIPNALVLPKDLFLENSLERYKISVGRYDDYYGFSRTLTLARNNINMEYGVFKLFESVEDLTLEDLNGITSLYQIHNTTQTFFKLEAIKVSRCNQLKSLFSVSMVRILSRLKRIKVSECKSLEEIVAFIEEEHIEKGLTMNITEFLQLHSLELNDLPSLTHFCFNNKVAFPMIETLSLKSVNCRIIWDIPTSSGGGAQIYEIVESSQTRIVSNDLLPNRSFSNLKTLEVKKCDFLLKLIPLHILISLSNLEELKIEDCASLEVVFDVGESDNSQETHAFSLKTLSLSDLPKLKTVCNKSSRVIVNYRSLQKLVIKNSNKLETFQSADEKTFPSLETLSLKFINCQNIWDIFTSNKSGTQILEIMKSSQTRTVLNDPLPDRSFNNLKTLKVEKCDFVLKLIPLAILRSLSNLEKLKISSCDLLEVVFDFGEFNKKEMHTFSLRKLHLSKLPKLKTIWGGGSQGINSFQNLKRVSVFECESLENIFPASIAKGLIHLQELKIESCRMEVVVANDEFRLDANATFVFPKLTYLRFYKLLGLKNFYPQSHTTKLPLLRRLDIEDCNGLEIFQCPELPNTRYPLFLNEMVIPQLEELQLTCKHAKMMWNGDFRAYHFSNVKFLSFYGIYDKAATFPYGLFYGFPKLVEVLVCGSSFAVIFSCLKRPLDNNARKAISIKGFELYSMTKLKHIWDGKCQMDHVLQNLKTLRVSSCCRLINLGPSFVSLKSLIELDVKYCNELTNLLTSSTAKTFMQLTKLKITRCNKIEEIITNGEEDVENEIVFLKLKTLELNHLPSCRRFCSFNHPFNFPLLDEVIIKGCPKFKKFCAGVLTTPLLKGVNVENNELRWESNLNNTIQQLFDEKGLLFGDVKIDEYPNLIDVWNGKHAPLHSLSNLTSLVMNKCGFLSNHAIPSYVLIALINLKKLQVSNCDLVKVIFDLEGIDIGKEANTLQAIPLWYLSLEHLPNLKYVWNKDPHTIHCFQHLYNVSVYECESLRSIFPASIAKGLTQLYRLMIELCGVEVIVAEDQTPSHTIHFVFPQLWCLHLIKLPNLKNFYPQRHTIYWPNLSRMNVRQCKQVRVFSWENPMIKQKEAEEEVENQNPLFLFEKVVPKLYQLVLNQDHVKMIMNGQFQDHLFKEVSKLNIDDFNGDESLVFPYTFLERFCKLTELEVSHSSFKEIFPYQGPSSDTPRKIPRLTSLILTSLNHLQNIWNEKFQIHPVPPSSTSFVTLNSLIVFGCHHLGYLLSTSITRSLVHLQRLVVEDCKMMEEIVINKGEYMEDIIVLEKLYHLKLINLPILKHFCSHIYILEFSSLTEVTIRGCSNMKTFCLGVLASPLLEDVKIEEDDERWEWDLNKTLELLFLEKVSTDFSFSQI